jgi:hypothetical protein
MRSSLIRRSAAVAVMLLAGVSPVACDDEPDPGPETESSSTPSEPLTSGSPTMLVEPTLPVEAGDGTRAGAEAFVQYYWDVVNYAQATGDVGLLRSLAQPSCTGCEGGAELIAKVYDRGGRITGPGYRVTGMEPARSPSGHWTVVVHTHVGTQVIRDAGDLNQRFPGGPGKWLMGVSRIEGSWSVTTLEDT